MIGHGAEENPEGIGESSAGWRPKRDGKAPPG
jgi:hypothetical protein